MVVEGNTVGHVLEKYQESAGTFWQGTTQLHAKLQTSGSVLTFQEKDSSSMHVATGKPSYK